MALSLDIKLAGEVRSRALQAANAAHEARLAHDRATIIEETHGKYAASIDHQRSIEKAKLAKTKAEQTQSLVSNLFKDVEEKQYTEALAIFAGTGKVSSALADMTTFTAYGGLIKDFYNGMNLIGQSAAGSAIASIPGAINAGLSAAGAVSTLSGVAMVAAVSFPPTAIAAAAVGVTIGLVSVFKSLFGGGGGTSHNKRCGNAVAPVIDRLLGHGFQIEYLAGMDPNLIVLPGAWQKKHHSTDWVGYSPKVTLNSGAVYHGRSWWSHSDYPGGLIHMHVSTWGYFPTVALWAFRLGNADGSPWQSGEPADLGMIFAESSKMIVVAGDWKAPDKKGSFAGKIIYPDQIDRAVAEVIDPSLNEPNSYTTLYKKFAGIEKKREIWFGKAWLKGGAVFIPQRSSGRVYMGGMYYPGKKSPDDDMVISWEKMPAGFQPPSISAGAITVPPMMGAGVTLQFIAEGEYYVVLPPTLFGPLRVLRVRVMPVAKAAVVQPAVTAQYAAWKNLKFPGGVMTKYLAPKVILTVDLFNKAMAAQEARQLVPVAEESKTGQYVVMGLLGLIGIGVIVKMMK